VNFQSEIEAAKFLLGETTAQLLKRGVKFVIVGGWSAFLFHSARYGHPGTFDVDVLLHPDSLDDGTFDAAAGELLGIGYLRAPKNTFQAHRLLNVRKETFVFHVDFLNERDPGNTLRLVDGSGRMKSIYTDAMRAVFKFSNYRKHVDYPQVCFPSPETYIVTKAAAAVVKKRERDAFDIFVTVLDQPAGFVDKWRQLRINDELFAEANEALRKAVEQGDALEKIERVLRETQGSAPQSGPMPTYSEIQGAFAFLY
jgi:hypothetical protein